MSQEPLVSQTTLADSTIHTAIRLPARPPSGYERLPHEEDDSDVELCPIKPTSDTEAGAVAIASPFPSPEVHDIGSSPQDGPHLPRMRISGLLKMFVILTTCGLPAALYFSAVVWFVGGT
ncbi:hypothetical protein LXA43DRAFT_1065071 [Ganoderma leucocontextum]|nr:hypothetical protein LXA43DRAFT_1065071 [Ganoderma leucocontextum]